MWLQLGARTLVADMHVYCLSKRSARLARHADQTRQRNQARQADQACQATQASQARQANQARQAPQAPQGTQVRQEHFNKQQSTLAYIQVRNQTDPKSAQSRKCLSWKGV